MKLSSHNRERGRKRICSQGSSIEPGYPTKVPAPLTKLPKKDPLLLNVALRDAVRFIDRLMPQSNRSGESWSVADVRRLAEIRNLAKGE